MKHYEKYQCVDQRWVKSIPLHWEFFRLKRIFAQRVEKNDPIITENILSLTAKQGVVPYAEKEGSGGNKPKGDMRQYNIARPNDLLVNCMNIVAGSAGVSRYFGAISPVYYALYPRLDCNIWYYHYLFRLMPFQRSLIGLGKGILMHESESGALNTVRMRISMDYLGNVNLPIPPRDEQDQIVRYLDWQVSKINRLIAAKRKEIELTREYALAKIEDVFNTTIGTDSDNIPIGRHIRKIESGTSVNSIIGTADKETPGVLSTSCVYGNHFDASQNKRVEPADYERVSCPVRKNTVIVSRMNTPALVGACGFSDKDIDNVFLPDRLWQVYFDDTLMPEFVWRYLSRPSAQAWFATIATGSSNTMKNITKPQFKAVLIPNVPSDMQRRIIKSISKITDERDTACQLYGQTISTLQALRTRLISDVVTGQIDVRGIEVPDYEHYDEASENATEESSDSDYDTEE